MQDWDIGVISSYREDCILFPWNTLLHLLLAKPSSFFFFGGMMRCNFAHAFSAIHIPDGGDSSKIILEEKGI